MRQEAEQEHEEAKQAIARIEAADYDPDRAGQVLQQLIESVNHHVKEEESEVFPKLRTALGQARLADLGKELAAAKLAQLTAIVDLEEFTRDELYELARAIDVECRSEMGKDDLIEALQHT